MIKATLFSTAIQTKKFFQIEVNKETVQIDLDQSFQGVISDIRNAADDIISEEWFYVEATDLEVVFCRCKDYLDELIHFLLDVNDVQAQNLLKEAEKFLDWQKDQKYENGVGVWLKEDNITEVAKALWEANF